MKPLWLAEAVLVVGGFPAVDGWAEHAWGRAADRLRARRELRRLDRCDAERVAAARALRATNRGGR